MVIVEKHRTELESLGLATVAGSKAFQGDLVKNHKGRRDIFRVPLANADGTTLLFLKRNWRPYKKDGIASLLKNGRPHSLSQQEWENSRALEKAGFRAAPLVAIGEECGPLWERFSFLITESAPGETVESFLRSCQDENLRRRVIEALAMEIQRLHQAGFASPDLFTRHIFVDVNSEPIRFCLIDMARLDRGKKVSDRMRARDLAALNITAPIRFVSAKERLRFMKIYRGSLDRRLIGLIRERVKYLLARRKFRHFHATD